PYLSTRYISTRYTDIEPPYAQASSNSADGPSSGLPCRRRSELAERFEMAFGQAEGFFGGGFGVGRVGEPADALSNGGHAGRLIFNQPGDEKVEIEIVPGRVLHRIAARS